MTSSAWRFAKGNQHAKGHGPPKLAQSAREALQWCFEEIGGAARLAQWANDHPDDFYKFLWGKSIPREIAVSGNSGTTLQVTIVRVDASAVAQLPEQALDPASAIELPSPPDGIGNALPDHTLPSYPHPDSVDGNAGQVAE